MYINEYKLVNIKDLSIGDSFVGIHYPKGRTSRGPTYTVKDISNTLVKCVDNWYHEITFFAKDPDIELYK